MQDGMDVDWPTTVVAEAVVQAALDMQPSALVSFDDYGVSGHVNHIATFKGCVLALSLLSPQQQQQQQHPINPIKLLCLESVVLCRKFSGPLDVPLSLSYAYAHHDDDDADAATQLCCTLWDPSVPLTAMRQHRSQLVWFRYLFIALSRYSYVNTFRCVAGSGSGGLAPRPTKVAD
jgi:N-acetylglucosaminylphosphatidylinositol deacetylase